MGHKNQLQTSRIMNKPINDSSLPHSEENRGKELRKMKRISLLALFTALGCLVAANAMGGHGPWGWLKAFGESAAVGALADWFAVVALFRHPMGQKWIPHTAIIPASKEKIADNFAFFVRDHFLEPSTLLVKIRVLDPAERLAQWLTDSVRIKSFTSQARSFGLEALNWLDDDRLRQAFKGMVCEALTNWDASKTAHQVFNLLTRDGRHQKLLDEALYHIGDFLAQENFRKLASNLMVKHARKEWPTIVKMVESIKPVDSIGDTLAESLAVAIMGEFQEVLKNPEHPIRIGYGEKMLDLINRLQNDPAIKEKIQSIKNGLIDHPDVNSYVDGLVTEVKEWMRKDLESDQSVLGLHLHRAMDGFGKKLAAEPSLRAAINEHILGAAERIISTMREEITIHIARTVKSWDDATMVREIELSVGKDLQFIRLNGTVVGGIAGMMLYGLAQFMPYFLHVH